MSQPLERSRKPGVRLLRAGGLLLLLLFAAHPPDSRAQGAPTPPEPWPVSNGPPAVLTGVVPAVLRQSADAATGPNLLASPPHMPPAVLGRPRLVPQNPDVLWAPRKGPPLANADEPPLLPPPKPVGADEERALLLGAARNAVRQQNWDLAISRFQEYLRRYGQDFTIRKEYAGVLVQAGRLHEALAEFRWLAAEHPDDRDVLVSLADAAVQAKDYAAAITALIHVLELTPGDRDAAVRLARAYTFDGDFEYALRVYDEYLAGVRPEDERAPRRLPDLLIDLGRPADALPFLTARLEKQPNDAEALATTVRAYARLDDHQKAVETLQNLADRAPRAKAVRQELGDALYASENYEIAALVYEQILQAEPGDGFALLGMARVQMKLFEPGQALGLLHKVPSTPVYERSTALAWAEYHQLVGEYLEAKQIYQTFLRRNEDDYDVRLSLGQLEEFIREDEKAKAEYAKIPASVRQARTAWVGVASTLTAQRRFGEAVDVCRRLLAEKPDDGAAMGRLVRTLGKMGRPEEAETRARAFLQAYPRDEPACLTVRLSLAKVLRDARKCQEAAQEYELVLNCPPGRIPETYYGLSRSFECVGDPQKAHQVLDELIRPTGPDPRNRLMLSDLFSADFDDGPAADLAECVLKCEPDNLAALIRLADAQARMDRQTGHVRDAVATAKAILAQSPTNVRGRLALARALGTAQDYPASVAAYEPLIAADPDFLVPQRERARMLYSDHQYGAGAMAYMQMTTPCADERLRTELAALAERDPRAAVALGPCLAAGLPGDALLAEASKAAVALSDFQTQAALERLRLDYIARRTEQEGSHLEGELKADQWRHYEVIPIAKSLIDLEPSNTSALFDLGQVFSTMKETRRAIEQYAQDVAIDPSEYEAQTALGRASLEMRPQVTAGVDFFQEHGFDGLANIQRTFYRADARLPFGDEDQFFSFGFARADFVPKDDSPLVGNIYSVGFQDKFCCEDRLLVNGLLNFEQYPDRISDRITFDAGARYAFCDLVTGRAGMFLENVEENGESMRQDIYRVGGRVGADFQPARIWTFGGTGLYYHYSDRNDAVELRLNNDVEVLPPPCQLKIVLTTDLLHYSEYTIERGAPPDNLVGTIHPYFAPNFYGYYEGRIEWKHWLSRDYFAHSNQCWYSLQYGTGWDNNFNNYNVFRVLGNYDVRPWLSLSADAQVILSPVYEATQAMAYVTVRFP